MNQQASYLVPTNEPDIHFSHKLWLGHRWPVRTAIEHFTRKSSAMRIMLERYVASVQDSDPEGHELISLNPQIDIIERGTRYTLDNRIATDFVIRGLDNQNIPYQLGDMSRTFFTPNGMVFGYLFCGGKPEGDGYSLDVNVWLKPPFNDDFDFLSQMEQAAGVIADNNETVEAALNRGLLEVGYGPTYASQP